MVFRTLGRCCLLVAMSQLSAHAFAGSLQAVEKKTVLELAMKYSACDAHSGQDEGGESRVACEDRLIEAAGRSGLASGRFSLAHRGCHSMASVLEEQLASQRSSGDSRFGQKNKFLELCFGRVLDQVQQTEGKDLAKLRAQATYLICSSPDHPIVELNGQLRSAMKQKCFKDIASALANDSDAALLAVLSVSKAECERNLILKNPSMSCNQLEEAAVACQDELVGWYAGAKSKPGTDTSVSASK